MLLTRRQVNGLLGGSWAASRAWIGIPGERLAASGSPAEIWRQHFPAFGAAGHAVYLDSAATTHRPKPVLDVMTEFYAHGNANPGRTQHAAARRAFDAYEGARQAVAQWINATSADEIVWTRGTTEAINLVASAWSAANLKSGDQILLTISEHASNMLPWQLAAQRAGATVHYVEVDDAGRISLEDLDRKLQTHPRLLAFSHVSNVAGYINPAADICARARKAGAAVLIDAAQSAPHLPLDVRTLGCDFLAFSSHKVLGPMGLGVLWAKRELLEAMPPYQAGSNMGHTDRDSTQYEHAAHKFGAGTPYVPGPLGLAAALALLGRLGRDAIAAHEHAITRHALAQLQKVPRLRLLGPQEPEQRIPVFSFDIAGIAAEQVQRQLDAAGIAVRAGDLSAIPLLKRFGVEKAVRASCYLYTTEADIDRLVAALKEVS